MKTRLNLTIDDTLLKHIKKYATKQQTSISELVEKYFKTIMKPAKRKNIFDMIDKLKKPDIHPGADLKALYYQDKAKKHGF
jgi:hypothetical protein